MQKPAEEKMSMSLLTAEDTQVFLVAAIYLVLHKNLQEHVFKFKGRKAIPMHNAHTRTSVSGHSDQLGGKPRPAHRTASARPPPLTT